MTASSAFYHSLKAKDEIIESSKRIQDTKGYLGPVALSQLLSTSGAKFKI